MAKTPPAAAAAPVLDDPVDMTGVGDAVAKKRFSLRLPKLAIRLPAFLGKLPLPKIKLSKKLIVILAGAVLGTAAVGAAAYAFWPAEHEKPHGPVAKKAKRAKRAASSAMAAASAASQAEAPMAAGSAPSGGASSPVLAASGPEESMDKLRRRLGEAMGGNANLQPDGPGELRLTARTGAPAAAAANVAQMAKAARHGGEGHDSHADADADIHAGGDKPAVHAKGLPSAGASHAHWSYDGVDGPDAWARLRPEYAKCATGMRQSPIDIRDGFTVQLDPVKFDYRPSTFSVVDNGHTVQVNVAPGNFIEVTGRRFELQQFHFHRPSEERIAGKQFDMVVHLVHKDADGRLAVVAVLLERGGAQPVVQSVWNNLPLEKGEEQAAPTPLDLSQLLPGERGYFTYMGSLTTPPCSEGVLWMVMKQPVPVSPEQLGIFARLYPMNARPIQSAGGRMIKESN